MSEHTYLQSERLGTILKDGKHVNAPYECQNLNSKIEKLQAQLKAVRECQPYSRMGSALIAVDGNGEVFLIKDVLAAAGEQP